MRHVVEAAGAARSTPPTASAWSRTTAAGSSSCPTPPRPVTNLWAEGPDADAAQALLEEWAAVVERAGS